MYKIILILTFCCLHTNCNNLYEKDKYLADPNYNPVIKNYPAFIKLGTFSKFVFNLVHIYLFL